MKLQSLRYEIRMIWRAHFELQLKRARMQSRVGKSGCSIVIEQQIVDLAIKNRLPSMYAE